jgi:hypothetical protein
MECCRPFLSQELNRARLLPISKTVALPEAIAIVRDTRVLPSQDVQRFYQARLVRVTHGRLAIWLDPFGVLDPQVVVNLFPQFCVRMELVKHDQ